MLSSKIDMSNAELLTQLTGINKSKTMKMCSGGLHLLRHNRAIVDKYELSEEEADKLSSLFELSKRMNIEKPESDFVTEAGQAYTLLRPLFFDSDQEHFFMIMMDSANRVIGVEELSKGDVDRCCIPTTVMLKTAIMNGAVFTIMAHNHPNGDLEASRADINNTKMMYDAFALVGIKMLDHIVMTDEGYASVVSEDDDK